MDKRYQVFVSSTFRDLEKERSEVIQALLELDCIPCVMELFPAADESQWTYIQAVIDNCDYYVVILAGKYGSISPDTGKSYTQMEYEYALSKGIPTIAFLHKDLDLLPMQRNEEEPDRRELLKKFRAEVENRLCKHWENADQLGALVSRSMTQLIKSRPAVGWVRANRVPDESANEEIARLRRYIEDLEGKVKSQSSSTLNELGIEIDQLRQGEDVFEVNVDYTRQWYNHHTDTNYHDYNAVVKCTWNEIFLSIAQQIQKNHSEDIMRTAIDSLALKHISEREKGPVTELRVEEDDFHSVLIQLKALDLIENVLVDGAIDRSLWQLTTRGEFALLKSKVLLK